MWAGVRIGGKPAWESKDGPERYLTTTETREEDMPEFHATLARLLEKFEGRVPYPYDDEDGKRVGGKRGKPFITGNLTIGVGWNLEENPLPDSIIDAMTDWMIRRTYNELTQRLPWIVKLNWQRQVALMLMAYQMGIGGLLKFRKMLDALEKEDWVRAQYEALDSAWGRKFKTRASYIANILRSGRIVDEE